jgi:HSP20 family protein
MAKEEKKANIAKTEATHPVSPLEEMENYFNSFFRHPLSLMASPTWPRLDLPKLNDISPSVDIFEENGDMVIKAEMPGIKKEDVDVSVTENMVTISGEKRQEEKVEKRNYHRVERNYGSVCRRFQLPEGVNSDKVKATFQNGVLEVRLPKTKKGKEKEKKITIS